MSCLFFPGQVIVPEHFLYNTFTSALFARVLSLNEIIFFRCLHSSWQQYLEKAWQQEAPVKLRRPHHWRIVMR
jgi:hypothetical protein